MDPSLVSELSPEEAAAHLQTLEWEEAQTFLRQAFVSAEDLDHLCSNPTDEGRFMNHSAAPNCGAGLQGGDCTRDVEVGEELTCDYARLGCPQWYQELCTPMECCQHETW